MIIVDYTRRVSRCAVDAEEGEKIGLEVLPHEALLTAQAYMWVSAELQVIRGGR
jgi:hypothetical protein